MTFQVLSDQQLKQMIEQDKILDELLGMRISNGGGSGTNGESSNSISSTASSSTSGSSGASGSSTVAAAAALTAVGSSVMMPPKPRVQAGAIDPRLKWMLSSEQILGTICQLMGIAEYK